MPYRLLLLLVMASVFKSNCDESAQYLRNVISDLRNLKGKNTYRRFDSTLTDNSHTTTLLPAISNRRMPEKSVPQLTLTKGELASLYEAAVSKGETVKFNAPDNTFISAAIHEIDDTMNSQTDSQSSGSNDGYYYYYYPIKSFLDEMSSQSFSSETSKLSSHHHELLPHRTTVKPHYQYHSHHHHHNVNIAPLKHMMDGEKKNKALEPLFMAISGFVGMAVMFALSVLVFPKFGIPKLKPGNKSERVGDIARIALRAIEGEDCTERFACELEKTARTFNLQENRFVKLFKRIAPGTFGKQLAKVNKYSNKQLKCTAIPCQTENSVKSKNTKGKKSKKS